MDDRPINSIVGDSNYDILNVTPNSWEDRYLDILSDTGFTTSIDKSDAC